VFAIIIIVGSGILIKMTYCIIEYNLIVLVFNFFNLSSTRLTLLYYYWVYFLISSCLLGLSFYYFNYF